MGLSSNRIQVQWSSSDTTTLAAAGSVTSDAITLSANAVDRELVVRAVPASVATSGDSIEGHWLADGDPDNDSTATADTQGTLATTIAVESSTAEQKRAGLMVTEVDGTLRLDSDVSVSCTVSAEIIETLLS